MTVIEKPQFIVPTHGYHSHKGPWLERNFYQEVQRVQTTFNRDYLVGFWTDFIEGRSDLPRKKRLVKLDKLIWSLPDTPMFTVVQHDDGLNCAWPKNLMVFGAGGVGDVPIPLLMPSLPQYVGPRPQKFRINFMGRLDPPNNRDNVRKRMLAAFEGRPELTIVKCTNFKRYCNTLRSSAFTLCPRGYGLTSFRLYEALALGTVPVYVHNRKWLPYTDVLDWDEIAVVCHVTDINELPERIAAIDHVAHQRMVSNIRDVFADYFTIAGVVKQVQRWLEKVDA